MAAVVAIEVLVVVLIEVFTEITSGTKFIQTKLVQTKLVQAEFIQIKLVQTELIQTKLDIQVKIQQFEEFKIFNTLRLSIEVLAEVLPEILTDIATEAIARQKDQVGNQHFRGFNIN